MKRITLLSLSMLLSFNLLSQKKIIINADALVHGADDLPADDGQQDSVFFFDKTNLNLYSGLLKAGNNSLPQIDSFGFGGTAVGQDVIPMGGLSFGQGLSNLSRGIISSTFVQQIILIYLSLISAKSAYLHSHRAILSGSDYCLKSSTF